MSLPELRGSAAMPNVTIFIPSGKMPEDGILADLTDQCSQLCTDMLKAAPENVHIIYVAVRHGRGHEAFAEIKYRAQPFRTKAVMAAFMERLDDVIRRGAGVTARIRCFGHQASAIHARN